MQPDPNTLAQIKTQIKQALEEDLGSGDLTGLLIPEEKQISCTIHSREAGVLCGQEWLNEVFRQLDGTIEINWNKSDGDLLKTNDLLCSLRGSARVLMTGERTALNFLQLLSAVATQAKRYTQAVADTNCKILDTRKTIPGLRLAEKYAVRCGGGSNHRIGLFDGILIKENHIMAAGSISGAILAAKKIAPPGVSIEIEVENIDELGQALSAGPDIIMLDNFSLKMMADGVKLTDKKCLLEASGNISLDNVRKVAATGVDLISIGALTKNITALDLSMRAIEGPDVC